MTCPKCNKPQHWTCGNKKCSCFTSIPKGEKPQRKHFDWRNWWKFRNDDTASCPYCGFRAHLDFWEEADMMEAVTKEAT